MSTIKILAVEGDPRYVVSLKLVIQDLGYELIGIVANVQAALELLEKSSPDLVLMDIETSDATNGIEFVSRLTGSRRIPIIYVLDSADFQTVQQPKLALPKAHVSKPYDCLGLQSAIELAMFYDSPQNYAAVQSKAMGDTFYIKDNNRLAKIRLRDIVVVEVDEKYCYIVTHQRRHIVDMPLDELMEKLPREDFLRVHKSFVIRKSAIEEVNVDEFTLRISECTIPIGKMYKEQLLGTPNFFNW